MQPKRIYMNKEDGSPSGGSPPPTAPTEPPASNAATPAPEPSVPVSQLKTVIGEVFGELRNGLFADLRKAGALGKDKPADSPAPSQTPPQSAAAAAPASTGLSASDVQSLLAQDRVFTRAEAEYRLTDTQSEFMRAALKGVPVEELSAKTSVFLRSMGIAKGAPEPAAAVVAAPPTTSVPAQSNAVPISDKGAPSPGGVTPWQRELAENPIGMSPASVNSMIAELGSAKATKMIVEAGMRQAERIRIQVKPQR